MSRKSVASHAWWAAVMLVGGAFGVVGCSDSDSDTGPVLGGESSDFGGSPSPCLMFERMTLIDADAATALGFDVPTLVSRVERDFDEPLRWMPGGATYSALSAPSPLPTRIQGRARILSYFHVNLDPESCDGTSCSFGGEPLECSDRLELRIEVELRTLDGIVDATAVGYTFQGRAGFSFELPAGTVFGGLPDIDRARPLSWLEFTRLGNANESADLFFNDERIEGDIRTRAPAPLWGHWPDLADEPPAPPEVAEIDDGE
jgi:hypothetical protein